MRERPWLDDLTVAEADSLPTWKRRLWEQLGRWFNHDWDSREEFYLREGITADPLHWQSLSPPENSPSWRYWRKKLCWKFHEEVTNGN